MNVDVVVNPALCLHKQEEYATEVNATQHQGGTHPMDIQLQVNMNIYTGTLIVMHATVMEIFYKLPDKQPRAINLVVIRFMMMQNGDVIKKTWIILDDLYKDRVTNNLGYVEDVNNCAKHKKLTVLTDGVSILLDKIWCLMFYPSLYM